MIDRLALYYVKHQLLRVTLICVWNVLSMALMYRFMVSPPERDNIFWLAGSMFLAGYLVMLQVRDPSKVNA